MSDEQQPIEAFNGGPKSEVLGDCAGMDQIPVAALQRLGAIFAEGQKKYGRGNWRKDPGNTDYDTERYRHALRHLAIWNEERQGYREPSGEDHLAKVIWFCVTQIERDRITPTNRATDIIGGAVGGPILTAGLRLDLIR